MILWNPTESYGDCIQTAKKPNPAHKQPRCMVFVISRVSGAHINPAVTPACLARGTPGLGAKNHEQVQQAAHAQQFEVFSCPLPPPILQSEGRLPIVGEASES